MKYSWALALAAAIQSCTAQTYTECNPTEKTCPADIGLQQYSFTTDFTTGADTFDGWNVTAGSITSTSEGAQFVISEQGDAPTIETAFYIFFGYFEIRMRAANGTGIVSTAILESDDLDEIDWEQVSTFDNQISTNYFGKGNTTSYDRATTPSVSSPSEEFHTYGISWTSSSTEWYIDGTLVRTLNYEDAVDGTNYPQTPMRIRIGIWAGGDPDNSEGTIEWAGGETDYTQAPFTMVVESVSITNYNPAGQYSWGDTTGSYESIDASNSTDGFTSGSGTTSGDESGGSASTASSGSHSSATSSGPGGFPAHASSSARGSSTSTAAVATSSPGSSSSPAASSTESPASSPTENSGSGGGVVPIPIPIPTGTSALSSMTPTTSTPSPSITEAFFNGSPGVLSSSAFYEAFAVLFAAVLLV